MAFPSVTVTIPATTANIGPGFDCLGAALTLHNRFVFSALEGPPGTVDIQVEGEEASRVAISAEKSGLQSVYLSVPAMVPASARRIHQNPSGSSPGTGVRQFPRPPLWVAWWGQTV